MIISIKFFVQFLLPLPGALQLEVEDDRQQGEEEEGEEAGQAESHGGGQLTLRGWLSHLSVSLREYRTRTKLFLSLTQLSTSK